MQPRNGSSGIPAHRRHVQTTAFNVAMAARDMVGAAAIDGDHPGAFIARARTLRVQSLVALYAAVQAEIAEGLDWASAAEMLRLSELDARRIYGNTHDQPDFDAPIAEIMAWFERSGVSPRLNVAGGPG